uniref:DUF7054 domain-containing protein n=1 Tax=Leersia perrieri TaxID=77586 RepID=A0A0D9VFM1_9ORYZ
MPERKKSRSRLASVRLGRSLAAEPSSSPSRRRGSGSGSGGRRVRLGAPPLWSGGGARVHPAPRGLSPPSPPPAPLERPHTCFDVFTPDSPFGGRSASSASLSNCSTWEEAKVVLSVTVEGSVGPVKAMVRLGASVGEAIAAIVERYGKEGRSPCLDPAALEAFQLHHSHFCLQSLNKNDKIGDVGGRNFYLHRNDGSNRIYLQSGESDINLVDKKDLEATDL